MLYQHPIRSRTFYVLCKSILDLQSTFLTHRSSPFKSIVNRAIRVSNESIAELIRFCSASVTIPHLTLVRIQVGVHKGEIGLALNLAQYSPEGASEPTSEPADAVLLLPRFAAQGRKRKRRPEVRLMDIKLPGVRPVVLRANPGIKCYAWTDRTFLPHGMELVMFRRLSQAVHRVGPVDLTLTDLWPLYSVLKGHHPILRHTWQLLLARSWKTGAVLRLLTPTTTLTDVFVRLVVMDHETEMVTVDASDGSHHTLVFSAVERWYQVPDRVRVVVGSQSGTAFFVVGTVEREDGRLLLLSPDLRADKILEDDWVCVILLL
jgi:hypothetical protein